METITISVRDIDKHIWKKFKLLCLIEDVPVYKKLNAVLKKEVSRKAG